ncbi:MAG: sialate O-acetylesterase [Verrucomicrobiales bacterium]|jgi:sialate O-acetylesterase|nr:sialate O-acetylesterase [Verrucomicrobiales bacterium]
MITIINGLAEGQVLQRRGRHGASVTISGSGARPGVITATLSGRRVPTGWQRHRVVGKTRGGAFTVTLDQLPVGGPYRLTLTVGDETLTVKSFYVGDLWLLAGQSNREGCGANIANPPSHPLIRAFSMRREWRLAEYPLHIMGESPDRCHHVARQLTREEGEAARRVRPNGVGCGIWFALEMLRAGGVPQGLICTAHGGTSMSQWEPGQIIDGEPQMYASALASLRAVGQPISGVLWYQGESDTDRASAALYVARMKQLVAALRRDLRQPALPWFTVQIARVYGPGEAESWNLIQEYQRQLPGLIRNLSVVPAIDLPLDDGVHLSADGQRLLADRLAREARRVVYGLQEPPPPSLKKIGRRVFTKTGHCLIDVEYANVVSGLRAAGEPLGFRVVDAAGRDTEAVFRVSLHDNIARLHCSGNLVLADARVCYGLGRAPVCNITDGRGHALPVSGPLDIGAARPLPPRAWLPYITTWRVTPPLTVNEPLDQIAEPDVAALGGVVREYTQANHFVNEHLNWERRAGQAYFAAVLDVPEPLKVKLLFGYDGPFRLWLDGKEIWRDMAGLNPAIADKHEKALTLTAGKHPLTVGMDLNRGAAWGFFLRLLRTDVSKPQLAAGDWKKIAYGV